MVRPSTKKGTRKVTGTPTSITTSMSAISELEQLRKQHEQSSKLTTYLRRQMAEKDKAISSLEQDILQLKEIHERDLLLLETQFQTKQEESDQSSRLLKIELQQMQAKLDSYAALEYQHIKSQQEVEFLKKELEDQRRQYETKIDLLKKEVLQAKYLLGEEYRDKIHTIEEAQKAEIIQILGPIAKATLASNHQLKEKLKSEEEENKDMILKMEKIQAEADERRRWNELLEGATTERLSGFISCKKKVESLQNENIHYEQENSRLNYVLKKTKQDFDNYVAESKSRHDKTIMNLRSRNRALEQEIDHLKYELQQVVQSQSNLIESSKVTLSADDVSYLWNQSHPPDRNRVTIIAEEISNGRRSVLKKKKKPSVAETSPVNSRVNTERSSQGTNELRPMVTAFTR
ncbi:hypothetical protein GEMRC1_004555 [Eukaryota sp. GEM-RC1]